MELRNTERLRDDEKQRDPTIRGRHGSFERNPDGVRTVSQLRKKGKMIPRVVLGGFMASLTASHLTSPPNKPKLSFNSADIYVRRVLMAGMWILGFHGRLTPPEGPAWRSGGDSGDMVIFLALPSWACSQAKVSSDTGRLPFLISRSCILLILTFYLPNNYAVAVVDAATVRSERRTHA